MTLEAYREVCMGCGRPSVVCYCRFVKKLETKTRVVILQHPRERKVPINTARIASLCLPDAELHVGVSWSRLASLADPTRPAALLYPGPGAIDVESHPPAGPITLVVVDGTWWQARKLVRTNPLLAALPRYAFRPDAPSNYRIRKEPQDDYVSTIEALVHMLGALEGDRDRFTAMLDPFRAMVEAQLEYAKTRSHPRHAIRKSPKITANPWTSVATKLRERASDVVCVHAESNAWPYNTEERAEHPDELVQWVARRPSTGQTLDVILAPSQEIAPATTKHTRIDRATLERGVTRDELLERWSRFTRPTDVMCAWGTYPFSMFRKTGGTLTESCVDIRAAARAFSIEPNAIDDGEGVRGRAGIRLRELESVVSQITLRS